MNVPKDLKYTKTHEWIRTDGKTITVGITDFAQDQLSDLTYVELPGEGDHMGAHDEVAVVESVKAASDIYAPAAGTIAEINNDLIAHPELVNTDPYGDGWLFKLTVDNPADLDAFLDADTYEELVPEGDEDENNG